MIVSNNLVHHPSNNHYEKDIHYVFEFCHWTLKLLGIYPFIYEGTSRLERFLSITIILLCFSILQFVNIPFGYYVFFCEKDWNMKIKYFGPLAFCLSSLFKYGYLSVKGTALSQCIQHVRRDWRRLDNEDNRTIMMKHVTMSRNLAKLCAIFLYTGGLSYHTIMPLLSKEEITENRTIRPLTYPGYEAFFDVQTSPAYEIVYCLHCFYVMVTGNITMAAYTLTAVFTTHACGQIEVQTLRLGNLVNDKSDVKSSVEERLAIIVRDHAEILRFAKGVESTLCALFFMEVLTSTLIMCLLEYYCVMEWETSDAVAILTYVMLLTSFTFNILIFCYVGELLIEQGNEITNASYGTDWYDLPGRKARDIVLLLAISKYPLKLTAGKMIVLSINTFGVVLKTSMVYLNMLRTMTEE